MIVNKYAKANVKVLWSFPILLAFLKLFKNKFSAL